MSFAAIGLHNPKDGKNVGSAIRAAYAYDARMVAVSGNRANRKLTKGMYTDTPKGFRHLPVVLAPEEQDILTLKPYKAVPVAVELVEGAVPLPEFKHPKMAYYIFGAEDATLGEPLLRRCAYVVRIPTRVCTNLAATVNVVLYDRAAKMGAWPA